MLAEKLNMTEEDAERWIVNLIRNARLDAKIDSKLVCYKAYSFSSVFKLHLTFLIKFILFFLQMNSLFLSISTFYVYICCQR